MIIRKLIVDLLKEFIVSQGLMLVSLWQLLVSDEMLISVWWDGP